MADTNKKYELIGRLAVILLVILFGWLIVTLVAGLATIGVAALVANIIPISCILGLGVLVYLLLKAAGVIK